MINANLMSRSDAAKYLGVTPQTLAVWACTKRYALPMVKIGRCAKYRRSDLDASLDDELDELLGDLTEGAA